MRYSTFLNEIRAAYEHRGGIKALALGKLDQDWFKQIQADAAWIINHSASSDVASKEHVTYWTRPMGQVRQFSLFNKSGRSDDYKGDFGDMEAAKHKRLVFPQLAGMARFAKLFGPHLRNLRLNGMGTSSGLSAHEENSIRVTPFGPRHIVRFHLPVFTNPSARMYLDDDSFHFEEGTLYFFHHGCVHAAANPGGEPRYHLVLDCFLTPELFSDLFPGGASRETGFRKFNDADARLKSEPYRFPEFVREDGRVITGGINYGRRAPGFIDYYRRRYPSLFSAAQR